MKKWIAIVWLTVLTFTFLSSCGVSRIPISDSDASAVDTSETEEESLKTLYMDPSNIDSSKNEETGEAKLIGFKTSASDYDGAFNSEVGWSAAGMGYIIKTENGSLIAIDGGYAEDATAFYGLLKDNSSSETVVVDYWILTHPHADHVDAFVNIANNGNTPITVRNIVFDFPTDLNDPGSSARYHQEVNELSRALGATVITPRKDDKIYLDGVELHFLYTPVAYGSYTSGNYISLIFTVKTDRKSIMITGDAMPPTLESVANEYKDALKCDILQMPHHFLCDTGNEAFYTYVSADTMLLPTSKAGFKAMTDLNSEYRYYSLNITNKAALNRAKTVYKAFDGNFEISF